MDAVGGTLVVAQNDLVAQNNVDALGGNHWGCWKMKGGHKGTPLQETKRFIELHLKFKKTFQTVATIELE